MRTRDKQKSVKPGTNCYGTSYSKSGEGYSVFKVVDSQVQKVPVDLKLSEGAMATIVSEGLQNGDQIVTEGTYLLQADSRIKIL